MKYGGGIIMSLESARAFIEKMETDHDFAKEVSECKDSELRAELVKKAGFDFTMEELKACRPPLTEEKLGTIVGGQYPYYCFYNRPI